MVAMKGLMGMKKAGTKAVLMVASKVEKRAEMRVDSMEAEMVVLWAGKMVACLADLLVGKTAVKMAA